MEMQDAPKESSIKNGLISFLKIPVVIIAVTAIAAISVPVIPVAASTTAAVIPATKIFTVLIAVPTAAIFNRYLVAVFYKRFIIKFQFTIGY